MSHRPLYHVHSSEFIPGFGSKPKPATETEMRKNVYGAFQKLNYFYQA